MSEKVKLGELGEIVSGSTPKTNIKEYWDGDVLWITPAEIQEDDYYIADTQRKITNLAVEKTNANNKLNDCFISFSTSVLLFVAIKALIRGIITSVNEEYSANMMFSILVAVV